MPARTLFLIRSGGPLWDGVEATIAALSEASLLGVTQSAGEARRLVPELQPELVVCSDTIEGISALPLLAELRDALPDLLLVVFGDGYSATELGELARLRVRAVLGWESLNDETFPKAHDALRSGTFAVWSSQLLDATFEALRSPPTPSVRVLLIDPGEVSRAGLRSLLGNDPRFNVVGHTSIDGAALAQRLRPNLVVLDAGVDGGIDVALVVALAAAIPEAYLCIYTMSADPRAIIEAVLAGADGYLLKRRRPAEDLLRDLFSIGSAGTLSIDRPIVLDARARLQGKISVTSPGLTTPTLTAREREVLLHIADGYGDAETALHLHIGEATIRTHLESMSTKLGARNRPHLVRLACEQGLLDR